MELKIAQIDYRIVLSSFIWLQVFVIILNLISITNSDWRHYHHGLTQNLDGKFFISCIFGSGACNSDEFKMLISGAIYIILSCISMILICCWIRVVAKSFRRGSWFRKGICFGVIALILQILAFIVVFSILKLKFYAITKENFFSREDHAGAGAQMAIAVMLIEFFLLIFACLIINQVKMIKHTKSKNNEEEKDNQEINEQEGNEHGQKIENATTKGNKDISNNGSPEI